VPVSHVSTTANTPMLTVYASGFFMRSSLKKK